MAKRKSREVNGSKRVRICYERGCRESADTPKRIMITVHVCNKHAKAA